MKSPKPKDIFKNSACRCIQQEMDLSELTWMDNSSYPKIKQMLKRMNAESIRMNLLSKPQMDLFVNHK